MMGDFPEEEADMPKGFFISLMNYKGEMESEIILAKIPTANPWELAVWMPMGGFNDCPKPAEQMAVFRYWYEKYGAIPALVSYDIWEMELSKPPVTNEECEQLACEQYAFCYDIVDQGVGSIRALASELRHATTWYFWWD